MIVKTIPIHTDHTQVELITYFQENSPEMGADRKRPVVLICPGGGYHFRSDREAEPVALRMCGGNLSDRTVGAGVVGSVAEGTCGRISY